MRVMHETQYPWSLLEDTFSFLDSKFKVPKEKLESKN